jgi:hypothetical protein
MPSRFAPHFASVRGGIAGKISLARRVFTVVFRSSVCGSGDARHGKSGEQPVARSNVSASALVIHDATNKPRVPSALGLSTGSASLTNDEGGPKVGPPSSYEQFRRAATPSVPCTGTAYSAESVSGVRTLRAAR